MYEEDLPLRIRQARPKTLQAALESALELESFQLASRHRNKWPRGSGVGNVWLVEEGPPSGKVHPEVKSVEEKESKFGKLEAMIAQLLQEIRKRPQYTRPPRNDRRRPPGIACRGAGLVMNLAILQETAQTKLR